MGLTDGNGMTPADVAAVVGNGNGNGWCGDNSIWVIILFLLAFSGGWGNGFGGGGAADMAIPYFFNNTDNAVQRGFDTAALTGQLSGIQTSLTNGFADAEVSACNRAMNSQATAYNNQIASMNQSFANQQALNAQLNGISSALQSCCCENRASVADLKYTVATEACADRSAINDALRDVLEATQLQNQRIIDQMTADKIDAKNEKIAELQNQLTMAQLSASQNAQTATIVANNEAQTTALERYLSPVPIPSYTVPAPWNINNFGCGCAA